MWCQVSGSKRINKGKVEQAIRQQQEQGNKDEVSIVCINHDIGNKEDNRDIDSSNDSKECSKSNPANRNYEGSEQMVQESTNIQGDMAHEKGGISQHTNIQQAQYGLTKYLTVNEGSVSIPSEIKEMPGINMVVQLDLESPQTSTNKLHSMKEADQQIETGSNHRPLLIKYQKELQVGIKYFKFLDFWAEQPSFMNLIEEVWSTQVPGNPIWRLQQKLKLLSKELSRWSKEEIGNVFEQVNIWGAKRVNLEKIDTLNDTDQSREELNKGQAEYIKWLGMKDVILRQKAQQKWYEEGDSNTDTSIA
ncbi:hypothetical protein A4A49_41856 [Nicotiana attenuata]|uniref:Uncharacterized protein n=1 Tax=Nicotiana attenuata TaxID=49451 RepID=A0A1J6JN87_NICAT|nr:hypothetical protein A4A49_41856 [Nicotiana attenuata]